MQNKHKIWLLVFAVFLFGTAGLASSQNFQWKGDDYLNQVHYTIKILSGKDDEGSVNQENMTNTSSDKAIINHDLTISDINRQNNNPSVTISKNDIISKSVKVKCLSCAGTGRTGITCDQCEGRGFEYLRSTDFKGGTKTCTKCDGTGKLKCPKCGGEGWIELKT